MVNHLTTPILRFFEFLCIQVIIIIAIHWRHQDWLIVITIIIKIKIVINITFANTKEETLWK